MNPSDILNGAADHIQQHGHWKGESSGPGKFETAPKCVIAAINQAARNDDYLAWDLLADPATEAMLRHLGTRGIVEWNDAPERTASEVIEALRACAVIEAAKERDADEDGRWGVPTTLSEAS